MMSCAWFMVVNDWQKGFECANISPSWMLKKCKWTNYIIVGASKALRNDKPRMKL